MWLLVLGLSIGLPLLLLLVTICSIKIKNPCVRPAMNTRIPEKPPSLRFNQALSVGSHNSCHVANVFSGWPCFPPHWGPAQWRYTHPALVQQLEQGVRHLEIDGSSHTAHSPPTSAVCNGDACMHIPSRHGNCTLSSFESAQTDWPV